MMLRILLNSWKFLIFLKQLVLEEKETTQQIQDLLPFFTVLLHHTALEKGNTNTTLTYANEKNIADNNNFRQ